MYTCIRVYVYTLIEFSINFVSRELFSHLKMAILIFHNGCSFTEFVVRLQLKYAELGVYLTNWIKEYNPLPNPEANTFETLKKIRVYIGNSGSMLITAAFTFQEVREWQLINGTKETKFDRKNATKIRYVFDGRNKTGGKDETYGKDREDQGGKRKAVSKNWQHLSEKYQLDVQSYHRHRYNCLGD